MAGRRFAEARRRLEQVLGDGPDERETVRAARAVVAELGAAGHLPGLLGELALGAGDPEGCARLSYRHVLGFHKLLLIDGSPRHMLRAHIWHPSPPRSFLGLGDIHNHRSALASYVVRGALAMELYEVTADGGLATTRYEESVSDEPGAEGEWLLRPTGAARLRLTQTAEYRTGSGYALAAYTLHRAWATAGAEAGPTVTLFLETGVRRRRHTDVFTDSAHRQPAVAKSPLDVAGYLAELEALRELVGG
ncbi:hypothetical protein [Streptomyces apocyni]|uniref:hypothetical protein n=1 Tax=Streptomyces apocyni TaxID=2654677 RepID=UPI0012E9BB3B|nr:hypothetical protein [Streptomyces apocyni]